MAYFLLDKELPKLSLRALNHKASQKNGLQLYKQLQSLNRFYLARGSKIELTNYKFFTSMAEELLISYRKDGVDIFGHTGQMRKNLNLDLKYEKKLSELIGGAFIEMGIIAMLGVCFQVFAKLFAGINNGFETTFLVLGWQLLGVLSFHLSQKWLRRHIFEPFYSYMKAANFLDISLLLGRPVNLINKRVTPQSLPEDMDLSHLKNRAISILENIKRYGIYDREQSRELVDECWYSYEQKLDKFCSQCKALKLGIIAAFFLTSYLFLFYDLVSSMGGAS